MASRKTRGVGTAWAALLAGGLIASGCAGSTGSLTRVGGDLPPTHARCVFDGFEVRESVRDGVVGKVWCEDPMLGNRCEIQAYDRGTCSLRVSR